MTIKSAVQNGSSKCFFDYPYSMKEHFDNWITSRRHKASQKYLGMCNSISENSSTDDSDREDSLLKPLKKVNSNDTKSKSKIPDSKKTKSNYFLDNMLVSLRFRQIVMKHLNHIFSSRLVGSTSIFHANSISTNFPVPAVLHWGSSSIQTNQKFPKKRLKRNLQEKR